MSLIDHLLDEMDNSDWDTFELAMKATLAEMYHETVARATNASDVPNMIYIFFENLFKVLPGAPADLEVSESLHELVLACTNYAESLVENDLEVIE